MKKTRQKIANTGRAIALLGAAALSALTGGGCGFPEIKTPTISGKATVVHPRQGDSIERVEGFVKNLPYNSDVFLLNEERARARLSKVRLSAYPLHNNNVGLGGAVQYVSGSSFRSHHESGPSAYIQGKPTQNSFGKLTGWYFPETNTVDFYGLLDTKRFYADVLGAHNTRTKATWVRPGLDYKISKNWSIGVEGKWVGKNGKLKRDYAGVRAGFRF